ncbi:MAG: glycosyltransferase family 39 protein [Acidobacteria bacterium]|nr:glycosyltransferase family 39 protein [Acidobacteriota bacterium]
MKRLLALIVGLGFVLRLLFLGQRQLGTEELMQALVIRPDSLRDILDSLTRGMYFPAPLDSLFQKMLTVPLGMSNWVLRFHAAIFGALSIWVFAHIARRLFGDRVALYSAALFALYPLHYHYSQEARPYSLLTLLTLLSYALLLKNVSAGNRARGNWWLLGLILTLLLYSSFLGVVVLVSQACGLLAARLAARMPSAVRMPAGEDAAHPELPPPAHSHAAGYALAAAIACALFLPWAMWAFAKPEIAPASEVLYPGLPLRLVKEIGDNSYVVSGLLLLAAAAGFRAMRRHGRRQSLAWLLTWFLVPLPAVVILAVWSGYFLGIAHVLHATPPLILLAGYGLSYVGERLTILPSLPYQISSPAIVYGLLWLLASSWIAYDHRGRELVDWRGAALFLEGIVREGDALSMPGVANLLEYHAPSLAQRHVEDLDPGPGILSRENVSRRIVVCYHGLRPEPCATFLTGAAKDNAWLKREFRGITVFLRRKA